MANAPFTIYEFWTEYPVDKKTGVQTAVDWVEYGPFGSDRVRNRDKVSRLLSVMDVPEETNPAAGLAKIRANFLKIRYEDWKAGREAPVDGTPLAAWNGVSPQQADILRTKGFKTVEDVARMTDAHMGNIPLPGTRVLIENAKRFIASLDSTRVAAELAARDEEAVRLKTELEETKAQQNEMARMLEELLAEKRARVLEAGDGGEVKRGPGRPPKQHAA